VWMDNGWIEVVAVECGAQRAQCTVKTLLPKMYVSVACSCGIDLHA
jgi:hypothetical protein